MKCKFCNKVNLEWPENWVKGQKPIEEETHITHDKKRCDELKNANFVKKKADPQQRLNAYCHLDETLLIDCGCEECEKSIINPWFCKKCGKHVSVADMR